MEIKAAQADRFLAEPPSDISVVLLYGPDTGLVSERATLLTRRKLSDPNDAFSVVRFESDQLAADPGRLSDEANAISMFGGTRVIRIRASGARSFIPALEPVFADPPRDSFIVIEAGDLKKTAPLRKRCETAKSAAALPCYGDADKAIDRIIDEEMSKAGLTIAQDARAALRGVLGADRMASRGEVVKLCLYAAGQQTVTVADVQAIIGDASSFGIDDLIDAAALGDFAGLELTYRRLLGAGGNAGVLGGAVLRHFQALHRGSASMERGTSAEGAVNEMIPPVFFTRKALVERQLRLWRRPALERALERLDQMQMDARLNRGIDEAVVGEALTAIASQAASMSRRS